MSLPVWTAATAKLVGARVTPVVLNQTVWSVKTAGTTGGSEPTWPTMEPWTVVDGTVTWQLASNVRQEAVRAAYGLLTAFKAANPTLLKQCAPARPKSFTNVSVPFAYVGARDETLPVFTAGIAQRSFTGLTIVVVDEQPAPDEAEARMDILIDGLWDYISYNFHAINGQSIFQALGVSQIDPDPSGGSNLIGEVISLGGTFQTMGRQ